MPLETAVILLSHTISVQMYDVPYAGSNFVRSCVSQRFQHFVHAFLILVQLPVPEELPVSKSHIILRSPRRWWTGRSHSSPYRSLGNFLRTYCRLTCHLDQNISSPSQTRVCLSLCICNGSSWSSASPGLAGKRTGGPESIDMELDFNSTMLFS